MGPGFFLEHGRPEIGISDSKPVVFWPDEWENVLHGIKAIDNYVQVYLPGENEKNKGVWRSGRVIEYCSGEDKYKILLDTEEGSAVENISENIPPIINTENDNDGLEKNYPKNVTEQNSLSFLGINPSSNEISSSFSLGIKTLTDLFQPEILGAIPTTQIPETVENIVEKIEEDTIIWESKDVIKISINKCKIYWAADSTSNKDNILNNKNSTTPSSSIMNIKNKIPLLFSIRDVGVFCRIWWSRYQRFFYGRIISYNSNSKEHRVTYEDGDTRTYDMSAKTYELIFLPATFSLLGAKDESECARRVAIWHIDKMILGTVTLNYKINFLKL